MRQGGRKVHEKLKPVGMKRNLAESSGLGELELKCSPEDTSARSASGDQVQALRRISTKLGQVTNLKSSLDELLVAIAEEMTAHSAALWIPDPKGRAYSLYETSYDGTILNGKEQLGHPYAARPGQFKKKVFARALARGLFTIRDVSQSRLIESEVAQWMMRQGIKSLLCVPFPIANDTAGVLTIRGTSSHTFSRDKKKLAQLLAHPLGLTVHLMQLAQQAEQSAILDERTRIAVEIHDSLAQMLVEIIMRLEQARQTLPVSADFGRESQLDHVQNLAREALVEAQRTVRALGPAQVERHGLIEALRELAGKRGSGVQIEFSVRGESRPFPQQTESEIFRISQEAVTNALRHASATQIHIELGYETDRIRLTVEDDGQGFDLEKSDGKRGFGLTSLRERVERSGGLLTIVSKINSGTRIVAEIPGTHCALKENRK